MHINYSDVILLLLLYNFKSNEMLINEVKFKNTLINLR